MADLIPGPVPNHPSEAWVPIQTWNMILMANTGISWFLSLDGIKQYRFAAFDATPMPPEPPPMVGQLHGWSISNSVAQEAGLLPSPQTPPVAQQQAPVVVNPPTAMPPVGN